MITVWGTMIQKCIISSDAINCCREHRYKKKSYNDKTWKIHVSFNPTYLHCNKGFNESTQKMVEWLASTILHIKCNARIQKYSPTLQVMVTLEVMMKWILQNFRSVEDYDRNATVPVRSQIINPDPDFLSFVT